MSSSTGSTGTISASMSSLSLKPSDAAALNQRPAKPKPKNIVVESWEDADVSSNGEADPYSPANSDFVASSSTGTSAPPPTPMTPVGKNAWTPPASPASATDAAGSGYSPAAAAAASPTKRPEKTDLVARRMIMSNLGLKAPKRTEQQKQYDDAMRKLREKERAAASQKREEEQQKAAEAERARAAMWED